MNEEITLREVADYLDHVGIQFMATIGLDGKPKVRPMQYMMLEDEKLVVLHQLKEGSLCRITGQSCYRTLRMQAGER